MIRRYAAVFRLTLAVADAVLALLVVLGAVTFRSSQASARPLDVTTSLPDTSLTIAVFRRHLDRRPVDARPVSQPGASDQPWRDHGGPAGHARADRDHAELAVRLKLPDVSRLLLIVVFRR